MSSLPKENFEIQKKFMDDPVGTGMLGSYINQENTIITRQAFDIIKSLPHDKVTAIEYYSTAQALVNAYDLVNALDLYKKAIEVSTDFNTEIAARRGFASLLIMTGKLEEGRHQYELAIDIFSKYKEYNQMIQMISNIETELSWAYAESNTNFKDKARIHIKNALSYLDNLPENQYKEGVRKKINQTSINLNL
jgi:tetratricopeptide (TPR) repeat protein